MAAARGLCRRTASATHLTRLAIVAATQAGTLRLLLVRSISVWPSLDEWRRPWVERALPDDAEAVVVLNQLTRSILSVVCVMIGLRLLDVFTVSEKLGVLTIIVRRCRRKPTTPNPRRERMLCLGCSSIWSP